MPWRNQSAYTVTRQPGAVEVAGSVPAPQREIQRRSLHVSHTKATDTYWPQDAPKKVPSAPQPEPTDAQKRLRKIGAFFFFFITLAILIGSIVVFISSKTPQETPAPTGYISPYNWANLSVDEKGRFSYTDDTGASASMLGIDTSEWDTDTNWEQLAADGVELAMIRIGYRGSSEGGLYEDNLFESSYKGATDNGILRGIYFFSQATNAEEGRKEAEFVLSILDGREVDIAIAFDHEGIADPESRSYGISDADYTAATQAFCSRIEHAGYTAAIYGNRYAIAKLSEEVKTTYNIWLAEWDTDVPHAQFDFNIWQFTNAGSFDGMWRRVDTNIWLTKEIPLITPETRAAEAERLGTAVEYLEVTDPEVKAPTEKQEVTE